MNLKLKQRANVNGFQFMYGNIKVYCSCFRRDGESLVSICSDSEFDFIYNKYKKMWEITFNCHQLVSDLSYGDKCTYKVYKLEHLPPKIFMLVKPIIQQYNKKIVEVSLEPQTRINQLLEQRIPDDDAVGLVDDAELIRLSFVNKIKSSNESQT